MVDYTSLTLLKAQLGISDSVDDSLLSAAITAASRAVDRITGTSFGVPAGTSARVYPVTGGQVWTDPFTDSAGLVVRYGSRGTYSTTVAATDYTLWPYNAAASGDAYQRIDFYDSVGTWRGDQFPAVEVTARWGYADVPADIEQATRIKAARLFRRKDSPEGIAGTGDFGVVRISQHEDPDVLMLLAPYREPGIA